MKSLTNYLKDNNLSLNSLNEELVITKDYTYQYEYYPETYDDLREIILEKYRIDGCGEKNDPVDFNDIDVSKMTEFGMITKNNVCHGIFENTKFEYIDVSGWDVSNVTNMSAMFAECKDLQELDLSNWDMSKVNKFEYMFHSCVSLKTLKFPANIKNNIKKSRMFEMFYKCDEKIIPDWYYN